MDVLVSVIVPVYNVEHLLDRCIQSILNQNLDSLELILVDDGSNDSSGEICEKYKRIDKRVKVLHQKNAGAGEARNAGLTIASGRYITFVDSDDYLPDIVDIYKKAVSVLENNNVDIVAWLWQFQDLKGRLAIDEQKIPAFFNGIQSTHEFAKGFYYGNYANGLLASVSNKMYKKDFIGETRFEGKLCEDEDWVGRLLAKNGTIYCKKEFWYVYAQNNSSLTHQTFSESNLRMFDVLKKRVALFKEDAFVRNKSMRLFLDLYIEFWYCAKNAEVQPYNNLKEYKDVLKKLMREDELRQKDKLRYIIFGLSPELYEFLVICIRGKLL